MSGGDGWDVDFNHVTDAEILGAIPPQDWRCPDCLECTCPQCGPCRCAAPAQTEEEG